MRTRVQIQEIRNVTFSENFAYVLNEWSLIAPASIMIKLFCIDTKEEESIHVFFYKKLVYKKLEAGAP